MKQCRSLSLVVVFVAFSLPSVGWATSVYKTTHSCGPSNFFDCFDFYTGADPTNGFVQYVDRNYAITHALIRTNQQSVHLGTDTTNKLSSSGPGRPSVRLESNFAQTHGLYVLDLTHMPFGCGTWPAFWSLGPDWPNGGEIDIIEGANTAARNLASLHTSDNCTIAGQGETGTLLTNDCSVSTSTTGCGVQDPRTSSYGDGFNQASGGVYAMEWTSNSIRVWFFPRGQIPRSINAGTPNPGQDFGRPMANFVGSCDIDEHMRDHRIIFDLTFCGDYAGAIYGSSSCPTIAGKSSKDSCKAYVANNPSSFKNAYWDIKSLNVYQLQKVPGSSSTRPTSSKTVTHLSSVKPVASKSSLSTHSLAMGASTTLKISKSSLPTRRPSSSLTVKPTSKTSTRHLSAPLRSPVPPTVGSRTFAKLSSSNEPECGKTFRLPTTPARVPSTDEQPQKQYDYAIHCNETLPDDKSMPTHELEPGQTAADPGDDTAGDGQQNALTFTNCIAHCDTYGADCNGLVFTNSTEPSAQAQCVLYSLQTIGAHPPSGMAARANTEISESHSGQPAKRDLELHQPHEGHHRHLPRRHIHAHHHSRKRQAPASQGQTELRPQDNSYVALRISEGDGLAELRAPAPTLEMMKPQVTSWVTKYVKPTTCSDEAPVAT